MYVDSVYKYFHNYRRSVEGATLKWKWKAELSGVSDSAKRDSEVRHRWSPVTLLDKVIVNHGGVANVVDALPTSVRFTTKFRGQLVVITAPQRQSPTPHFPTDLHTPFATHWGPSYMSQRLLGIFTGVEIPAVFPKRVLQVQCCTLAYHGIPLPIPAVSQVYTGKLQ
jgi:hypothetical protein